MSNLGGSTGAVFRWLEKKHESRLYGYQGFYVWERMPYGSLEEFTKTAKVWLGDNSELRTSTLKKANWQEIYDYFRKMSE